MNWAQRRKLTYIAIVVAFFAVVGFAVFHKVTAVAPTCFDNKKNGDETGVDCGGGCTTYCANQLADPVVEWVRVFPVTHPNALDGQDSNIVDAVAYIQHGYPAAGIQEAGYDFKLYDANNTVLAERTGTTYIGPAGDSAIVETLIPVKGTVALARFSFSDPLHWQKISPTFLQTVINTDRYSIDQSDGTTRLTATIQNQSRYTFSNLDAVVIFYDKDGNAIGVSKVVVPSLAALQSRVVYFTWPYTISGIARTEILPRFNPFTATKL